MCGHNDARRPSVITSHSRTSPLKLTAAPHVSYLPPPPASSAYAPYPRRAYTPPPRLAPPTPRSPHYTSAYRYICTRAVPPALAPERSQYHHQYTPAQPVSQPLCGTVRWSTTTTLLLGVDVPTRLRPRLLAHVVRGGAARELNGHGQHVRHVRPPQQLPAHAPPPPRHVRRSPARLEPAPRRDATPYIRKRVFQLGFHFLP